MYMLIAVGVLAVIVIITIGTSQQKPQKLSPLGGLAFRFVIGGLVFSENRIVGYGLMAVGVVLAIVDAVRKSRQ